MGNADSQGLPPPHPQTFWFSRSKIRYWNSPFQKRPQVLCKLLLKQNCFQSWKSRKIKHLDRIEKAVSPPYPLLPGPLPPHPCLFLSLHVWRLGFLAKDSAVWVTKLPCFTQIVLFMSLWNQVKSDMDCFFPVWSQITPTTHRFFS